MADETLSEVISFIPIGTGLDAFRASFYATCENKNVPCTPDALSQLDEECIHDLALDLAHTLRNLPAIRFPRSNANHITLRSNLLKLISAISSDEFDRDRIKPLLNTALVGRPDSEIWDQVWKAVVEITPPRAIASPCQQISLFSPTDHFPNSECGQNVTDGKDGTSSRFHQSILNIPESMRENETVGAGISSWVHRLDAVAKIYTGEDGRERERELAVFKRLGLGHQVCKKSILRYYGVLNGCAILQFAVHGSIRQHLRSCQQQPPLSVRLRWAEQTTDAIAFLHSKGVMHCDISSNNIFLDDNLNAMVGDFAGSSIDGEQCLGWYETSHSHPDTDDPSEKSEIFALGSTFYEILMGEKPFNGRGDDEIEQAFRAGDFPSLESLPALRAVILDCWTGRYETTIELLRDVKTERYGNL